MEKKTIGRFISVLRKASGMTQRELAERLFVSDKTVSRWECDECTPDLTLIPAIAEIFGITTDELLRGERSNNASINNEAATERQKTKSDKQFKTMLYNRGLRYKNLTLISVGLIVLSLIAAMIFNLGFLKGVVGFGVAVVFIVAGIICQVSFASSAHLPMNEDEEDYSETVKRYNSGIAQRALSVVYGAVTVFAFILPLAMVGYDVGLTADSWLLMGTIFALVALVAVHLTYVFIIRRKLIKKGLLYCDNKVEEKNRYQSTLLRRTLAVAFGIAVILFAGIVVLNSIGVSAFAQKQVFTDEDGWESFKKYMKEGRSYVDHESNFWVDVYQEPVYEIVGSDVDVFEEETYLRDYLYDQNGNECIPFEFADRFYSSIEYLEFNEDGSPKSIAVYTSKDISDARAVFDAIEGSLLFLMAADVVVCSAVYIIKMRKYKTK